LAIPTHKRPERVSDGISTQVVVWMINKCRIRIIQRKLYNTRDPPWRGDRKFVREIENFTDTDVHHERTRGMEAQKYLRKGCCHHIKCFAANFLTALTGRRTLNSTTLAIPTHREPERVSYGTSTQVVVWMINKCRIRIVQRNYITEEILHGGGIGNLLEKQEIPLIGMCIMNV